ncbi:MAG: PH domain-containing protein, partial [Arenimonas sp.]
MTTPSDPGAPPRVEPAEGRERRLHPWSWLFVLLSQLRQFIVPLFATFFLGGDRNELLPLIGVGVLALVSVAQYFTYRYRVGSEGLTIRSGLFQRTVRHIPFDRLHNVALQQSLLHRWFGVAEVRLESAGGSRPEASMRVLSLADAHALEKRVRDRAAGPSTVVAGDDAGEMLLALDSGELVRLGLISNRGMFLVATAFAAFTQVNQRLLGEMARSVGQVLLGWSRELHLSGAGMVVGAVALVVLALVAVRALSVAHAFQHFHGFVL